MFAVQTNSIFLRSGHKNKIMHTSHHSQLFVHIPGQICGTTNKQTWLKCWVMLSQISALSMFLALSLTTKVLINLPPSAWITMSCSVSQCLCVKLTRFLSIICKKRPLTGNRYTGNQINYSYGIIHDNNEQVHGAPNKHCTK
jgi:hypothetical protein